MYLNHLRVRNCKLLKDLDLSFRNADGTPRMWTTIIGENGLCKTTLLRCIAMASLGPELSNVVADVPSLPDKRSSEHLEIMAQFSFGNRFHSNREYPGITDKSSIPFVWSRLRVPAKQTLLRGTSGYSNAFSPTLGFDSPEKPPDATWEYLYPISEARSRNLSLWFCAAYGVGRILRRPFSTQQTPDANKDRVSSLFDSSTWVTGTGFADLFPPQRARRFANAIREALVDRELLPKVVDVELRGQGGVASASHLVESHRFDILAGVNPIRLPATWLSQGYQAIISLIADMIGQVWFEADHEIPLDEMEGLVLIDEADLHLHPRWQEVFTTKLRRAFPSIQFVVTTHSPMMLCHLREEEVLLLKQGSDGSVFVDNTSIDPRFLTGSDLYREFFGMKGLYGDDLGEELTRYLNIASDPFRSEDEDTEVHTLHSKLKGLGVDLPIEPVARSA